MFWPQPNISKKLQTNALENNEPIFKPDTLGAHSVQGPGRVGLNQWTHPHGVRSLVRVDLARGPINKTLYLARLPTALLSPTNDHKCLRMPHGQRRAGSSLAYVTCLQVIAPPDGDGEAPNHIMFLSRMFLLPLKSLSQIKSHCLHLKTLLPPNVLFLQPQAPHV